MGKGVKGCLTGGALLCAVILMGGCTAEELTAQVPEDTYLELGIPGEDTVSLRERGLQEEESEDFNLLIEESEHFAYDRLPEAQQLWYLDIERCLGSMSSVVRLSKEGLEAGLDEQCIDDIFQCVMNDHPEIFYVDGYSYSKYMRGDRVVGISFSGTYNMKRDEAEFRKKVIEAYAQEFLSGIPEGASEYEQVKYVYEKIIQNTEYDLDAPDSLNIYSVLVNRASVCMGYAKATQYLLNRAGIECTLVQGVVDTGEGHAWNLVKVDGCYYYLDTTWGDVSYQITEGAGGENSYQPSINYDYLCVTSEQLFRTHTLDNAVAMPECTATAANYYVRENALFTSYDREQMAELFERADEQGREDVTVKCQDAECFQRVRSALIDNQEIFIYMPDGETVVYACNDKQLSLTFWRGGGPDP